jgi:hypothetical protein
MKKLILSGMALIAAVLAVMAFTYPTVRLSVNNVNPPQEKITPLFPEDVQKVFESSCFDCHGAASSNTKAKLKLNLSKWSEMSDAKKVGKMEAINDMLKKGDMPPARFVSKYPDRAPKQEQKEIIYKWVTEESAKLMGE